MNVSVVATGHTQFGKDPRGIGDIMIDACNQALETVPMDEIDAIYISNFSSSFANQCHLPSVLASKIKVNKEITRVESACASGGVAFKEAAIAIRSGLYNNVLVLGVEKMTTTPINHSTRIIARAASQEEMDHGATFPSLYALMAQRHFFEYGTTEEHLAKIAVKNHNNALNNSNAQFHKKITIEDVMLSKYVATPLKVYDCSPITDGAAALVLSSKEKSSEFTDKPIHLIGIGHDVRGIELYKRKNLTSIPAVGFAAQKAYQMSGLSSQDIEFAEVHDCFTIAELIQIEDLRLCNKGDGKKLIENGETEIGGRIPINPSGGLKAKGHPIGATGISQVVETVTQLQENSGKNQISNANVGLCCNIGGTGGTAVVSIFSR